MIKKIIWLLVILSIAYLLLQLVSYFFLDFEWFRINNGLNIFWTLLFTKSRVHALFAVFFIALFFLNFLLMRALGGKGRIFTNNILDRIKIPLFGSTRRALFAFLATGVIAAGVIMGFGASAYWKEYMMFTHSVPFSEFPHDPVFNLDIGFYIFSLPFYEFLYKWLMTSLVVITAFSVVFHIINGGIMTDKKISLSLFTRAHLSTLTALIVLLFGIGYRLSAYQLLFSQRGKFFGAGYTAVNAELLAFNVCMIISFIAAALLLFNIFKRSFLLPAIVLVTLIPAYFILGTLFPSLQQRYIVEPNELDKERPYIENNIKFTRIAYGIGELIEKQFANDSNLVYKDIVKNRNTIRNIRLWDWRPLRLTYKQLQELKPYYQFNDVDVDRYMIDGNKTAVNISARELAIEQLSQNSQTWLNQHLIYTHGYGMVLSRVDKITPEGLPEMLIYDIPPKTKIDIAITQPRIYYGEHKNPYIITNTTVTPGEFDYPYGDQNKYTKYSGTGGSSIDSIFKRLLFAITFNDINILISNSIHNESRILYRRNIKEMVTKFTPFLEFEEDPYIAIADGRLFWIIDAYTTTDRFPYSTPIKTKTANKNINYIRNSVKVIIDAYNGTMNYYISDNNDPIVKTYANIFPGLFKKFKEMPDYLKSHIRYPETIFNIQANILLRYHMTDVNVFYNNEDTWDIPKQIYENNEEPVQSYYLVTNLPGEDRSEFILMMPFTPVNKDNMTAFLVTKCDPPHYGQMTLFTLPKEKLSYGPMQIEARIDQDAEISKQLSLWSQKGSSVIRGNMLIIPIEESLLFIEALYLKAETSEMPELKRVVLSFEDKIVMEENLGKAIEKIFVQGKYFTETVSEEHSTDEKFREYAAKAYMYLNQAEENQRKGDWAKYGEEINKLKEILTLMKELTN
ncbi:MAG: UPF0182 family protein [Spirochaetes bacterium]|nr:UPF0182 family protein [Spirochaetota bacterium]